MEMFTEPSSWKWHCFIVESNWNREQGCPLPEWVVCLLTVCGLLLLEFALWRMAARLFQ